MVLFRSRAISTVSVVCRDTAFSAAHWISAVSSRMTTRSSGAVATISAMTALASVVFPKQPFGHVIDHRGDFAARAPHPIGKDRAVDWHPVSRHDLGLPVERHMFGMLGDGNLSQKGFRRPASFQKMRRRSGLDDARSTLGACVFRADRDDHLVARRDPVEPFRPVFADPDHVAATAGTSDALGLDHSFDPRQVFGQCTGLALLARSGLVRIGCAGFDLFLDGGDPRLCLGDRRFKVFQRQFHLRRIELFRFRRGATHQPPELCGVKSTANPGKAGFSDQRSA